MHEKNVFSFPNVCELGCGYRPDFLLDFLKHLHDSHELLAQAMQSLQWFPVGFHGVHIAMQYDDQGEMIASLQMNLYHPEFCGNDDTHAHARYATSFWYAPQNTRQIIRRSKMLPPDAQTVPGVDVERKQLVVNCLRHLDGRRPEYNPVVLGERWVVEQSCSFVPDQGHQRFQSFEIHNVGFQGKSMGISLHYKGKEEPPGLNTIDGLIAYKGLTQDEAHALDEKMPVRNNACTIVLPSTECSEDSFQRKPAHPSEKISLSILETALQTTELLQ